MNDGRKLLSEYGLGVAIIKESKLRLIMIESNSMSAIDTAEVILQAYAAGKRNFENANLIAAKLRSVDLKGADLSYADLSHADLSHANLRGADLSYANLCGANLSGTDLRGAMLIGTDLRDAILDSANLHEADYDPETTQFPHSFDPMSAGLRADR
jgi:hypothetical protein